jgi:predicted DCC family thiol-disulfide oxidoreductase YuxK
MPNPASYEAIVVFDGECGFCSSVVTFALRHEASPGLIFTSNSSQWGRALCARYGLEAQARDTIIVIAGGTALIRSDAVIHMARFLKPPFSFIRVSRFIPRPFRDAAYRCVAAIRHRLPGIGDRCELLPPEQQARIVESAPNGE